MRVRRKPTQKTSGHTRSSKKLWHTTPLSPSRQADGLQSECTVIIESRERAFDIITGARIIERAAGTIGGGGERHQIELNRCKIGAGPRMEVGKVTFGVAAIAIIIALRVFL